MEARQSRALVRYLVEVWAVVDIAEQSVDRVVVRTDGLGLPIEIRGDSGEELADASRAAVLDALARDTWPSWNYE